MFILISFLVVFFLIVIEGLIGLGFEDDDLLATIYQLGVLVPTVAVGVRRMHDTGHSGWWYLFPIVNFFCDPNRRPRAESFWARSQRRCLTSAPAWLKS